MSEGSEQVPARSGAQGLAPGGKKSARVGLPPAARQRIAAAWHRITRRPTWLLGAAGLALLAVSAVRIIATASGSGLVTIVIAGAVLLVSPFVISRVEKLSVSSSGLELQLAKDMADLGAPKAAQILDNTDLAKFADSYAFVHKELADDRYYEAKIQIQDLLVDGAATLASTEKFDATEVRSLFTKAAPTMRVLVLGLMQGDPSLADFPTIAAAIQTPSSKNEQYQGLRLAEACWYQLSAPERAALRATIQRSPDIAASTSRRHVADQIMSLPEPAPAAWPGA